MADAGKRTSHAKPIICIETGEEFADVKLAARRADCEPAAI